MIVLRKGIKLPMGVIRGMTIDKKGCKVTKNEYTEVKHVDTLKGHDKKKKKVNEGGKVLPNHFNAIELAALTDGKKDHDNMGNKNKQTIRKGIRNGQSELVKLSPKTKDLPKQKESDCNTDASTNNIHDTVDGSGNPKYINLVKLGLDKSLSDKETKNNNSGKKDLRKKDLSNKQNKFSDTDTKRIRNLIKTATYENNKYVKHNENYIYYSPIKGNMRNITKTITLGIHIRSTENLKNYIRQVNEWKGPVILSVFMEDDEVMSEVSNCAYCRILSINKSKKNKIWAYFIYNLNKSNVSQTQLRKYLKKFDCSNREFLYKSCSSITQSLRRKIKEAIKYPINSMRNIIYKETKSNYVVLSESDQYFSNNFYNKMLKLSKKYLLKKKKNALVFRSFEIIHSHGYILKNKKQLNKLIYNGHASEFEQININNKTNKLDEWLKSPERKEPSIQYQQPYNNGYWEPQIVTRKDIPLYEESFPYPLDVTTEHRREMCRGGYHFLIVNDIFAYHQVDEKTSENILFVASVVQSARKDLVKAQLDFHNKLDILYPKTKNTCFT
uniref:SET domain protein n=1 Tax=Parastrongyloides trichosuri TaxID=131310 RepID=A0A0N4ZQQ4_PARTI